MAPRFRLKKRRFSRKPRTARRSKSSYPRRPRYYRRKGGNSLSVVKVKCNGQVQPFGKYRSAPPYWKSKLEKLYFSASRNTYQTLTATQLLSWTAGRQGVSSLTLWSATDIIACLNSVGQAPTASGQVRNTARSYLQKCYAEFNMTNSCNYPIEFSIFCFKSKRDAEDDLVTCWTDGIDDMTGNAVTATSPTTYGQTPFENPAINTYYKCHKVLHYNVNAGQTFKFTSEINLFRLFNNELLQSDLQVDTYLKGITETFVFIAKGAPSQLTTGGNQVGVPGGNVSCVFTKKYQFKYIQDVNWNTNEVTNLSTTGTNVLNPTGYNAGATLANYQVVQGAGV